MIGQVGGSLRHPAGVARGADASAFAGEGDEKIMTAVVAASTSEPIDEDAAFQKTPPLPFGVGRNALLFPVVAAQGEGGLIGFSKQCSSGVQIVGKTYPTIFLLL